MHLLLKINGITADDILWALGEAQTKLIEELTLQEGKSVRRLNTLGKRITLDQFGGRDSTDFHLELENSGPRTYYHPNY